MRHARVTSVLVSLSLLAGASVADPTLTVLQPLAPATVYQNTIVAINNDGSKLVGRSLSKECLWTNGVAQELLPPAGGHSARVEDLSDDGSVIVGGVLMGSSSLAHGLIWINGSPAIVLTPPPGLPVGISLRAVSADGTIAFGRYGNNPARFVAPDYEPEILALPAGAFAAGLTVTNAAGTVAAGYIDTTTNDAFIDHLATWSEASGVVDHGVWPALPVLMNPTVMTDDGELIIGMAEIQTSGSPVDTFEWAGEFFVHPEEDFHWGVSGDGQRRLLSRAVVPSLIDGGSEPIAVTTYLESLGMDLSPWRTVRPERISRSGTALAGWIVPVGVSGKNAKFVVTGLPAPDGGSCTADYNGTGDPGDILDFLDFMDDFGSCENLPSPCGSLGNPDLNADTTVDILDFLDFLDAFGTGC